MQPRQKERFCIRRTLSGCCQRRIFRGDPAQKCSPFLGLFEVIIDTRRGRKQRDRRRVDNLKQIKTKGVSGGGQSKETGDGEMPRTRRGSQAKSKSWRAGVTLSELVASATDVIPCSSAAFVTATTSS